MAMSETIGIVAPVPKGEWSNETVYQSLNIVRNNGVTYIAKKGSEGIEPGISVGWEEYWSEIVKDGNGGISGVSVAGTKLTPDENGIVNIPPANAFYNFGLLKSGQDYPANGVQVVDGTLKIIPTNNARMNNRQSGGVTPQNTDYLVRIAMCDGKGAAWTEAEQKAARDRIGEPRFELIEDIILTEDVSAFTRNTEPDGTSYNFKKIVGYIIIPASSVKATSSIIRANVKETNNAVAPLTLCIVDGNSAADTAKIGAFFIDCTNGYINAGGYKYSSGGSSSPVKYSNSFISCDFVSITSISIHNGLPAGARIKIYGVRI